MKSNAARPVRLIGLPTDINSSYLRGAAAGPAAIRAALASDHANMFSEGGLEIGVDTILEDGGDLPLRETFDDDLAIGAAITELATLGRIPLILGGDHSVSYPVVAAIAAVHGPLDILHIDAHPDLYDHYGGNLRSHASPFARIMEGGHCRRLVQVGIRTLNRHCREQAARFGVEIVEMRDFGAVEIAPLTGPCYVSIDLDGFDPAFAPGVSHPEPGGLSVREVLWLLGKVQGRLVGADIVELNPARDINDLTATLAAKLVKELCALSAT